MSSTYLSLRYHVIFATRHRAPSIHSDWMAELHRYLGGTIKALHGYPIAVGGTSDHVHLLFGAKATQNLSYIVQETKKASQSWAAKKWEGFRWQEGYAGLTVGSSEVSRVAAYIANQEEHHKRWTSQDELRAILEEHGIEYDERYFE